MRLLWLVSVIAAFSFTPQCLGNNEGIIRLGKRITFFSADLSKVLNLRTGNIVFSPVSIHMALTMALLGAKGVTAREMITLLELYRMPDLEINYKAWLDTANVNCDLQKNCQMRVQNSFRRIMTFIEYQHYNEHYLKALFSTFAIDHEHYNLTSGNTQISCITENNGLYNHRKFSNQPVFLSAINIKLFWKIPFVPQNRGNFFVMPSYKRVRITGMKATGKFKYAYQAELRCHVVRIPFENDRFGFYVVLPIHADGLAPAENMIARHGVNLDGVFESVQEDRILTVTLPTFAVVHKINLEEPLHQMGMHSAFSPNADFTNATPQSFKFGQVRHRMKVSLNEAYLRIGSPKHESIQGPLSAGVISPKKQRREVAVEGNATLNHTRSVRAVIPASQNKTLKFIDAIHPFLYFLRDDLHNLLLLHGRFVKHQTNVITEY